MYVRSSTVSNARLSPPRQPSQILQRYDCRDSSLGLILASAGLLQKFVTKPANTQLSPADNRSLSMLILIVSLLCEHCDFDHLGDQREGMYEQPQ